jgi:hypothetical protein
MTRVVILEDEPDGACEQCGKTDELRPYGKRKPTGERMRVCYGCAMLDEAEASKAFAEVLEGKTGH